MTTLLTTPLHAELATRALLSRSAVQDNDPYERALRDCLCAAHAALGRCPGGPLRARLQRELAGLAACCARDAEVALAIWHRTGRNEDRAQARMAQRLADATRDLSALAAAGADDADA